MCWGLSPNLLPVQPHNFESLYAWLQSIQNTSPFFVYIASVLQTMNSKRLSLPHLSHFPLTLTLIPFSASNSLITFSFSLIKEKVCSRDCPASTMLQPPLLVLPLLP